MIPALCAWELPLQSAHPSMDWASTHKVWPMNHKYEEEEDSAGNAGSTRTRFLIFSPKSGNLKMH